MLEQKREKFKKIEIKIGGIFSEFKITPNQYTLISLFFVILSFYFLIGVNLILAIIFFIIAVFLDFIDGAVARFTQKATKRGAFLDTVCDRYVEGIILLGFLFLSLPDLLLPAEIWIFLSLFGSLMTTYSKAAAKEKGIAKGELKRGLAGRAERVILIFLAMLLGIFNLSWIIYPIVILAILSNITALQRIYFGITQKITL